MRQPQEALNATRSQCTEPVAISTDAVVERRDGGLGCDTGLGRRGGDTGGAGDGGGRRDNLWTDKGAREGGQASQQALLECVDQASIQEDTRP